MREEWKLPCRISKPWRFGPTSQSGITLVCAAKPPGYDEGLTRTQFTLYLLKVYLAQLQ